jgi:dipeptidyl aminopeptidase/acylaminoacyl peptidase
VYYIWPENPSWSYQIIRILSQAQFGGGEVNEILDVASKIDCGDYESFHREWMNIGNRTLSQANEAMDLGKKVTARAAYLRAANYIRMAEFFLQPDDKRMNETYLLGVEAFRNGAALMDNPPEIHEIPFEGTFLPTYFYKVPNQENGPLTIVYGGLESTAEEMWYGIVNELLERGVSVLAVEGPGQGGALRLNNIVSRPEMNVAGTASLDYAIKNLNVDPDRIGILAFSMGGYHAARMAAFEPRFKACAILGAVYDYSEVWDNRPDDHPLARILQHIVGADNMQDAREKLKDFNLREVAEKISCPTYILHGENDRNVAVSHAYRLYNDLTCPREIKIVPSGKPGSAHCQLDNMTEIHSLFDWLQSQL